MQVFSSIISHITLLLSHFLFQAQASPIPSDDPEAMPFTDRILALQQRLVNVTHTTDRWLRRQRDRADSFVTIINRSTLGQFLNTVQLVDQLRRHAVSKLNNATECTGLNAGERAERLDSVLSGATAMGSTLAGCAALIHDDLNRVVKQQFYTYYRDLQTQSLSGKSSIFLGFSVYNAVTQQPQMGALMEELVEQVERSMSVYLRPDVEAEIGLVAERGRLIVDMATTCAFDVAVYYSEMVHTVALADCS